MTHHALRTTFFGTPDIAVPALRALANTTELVLVVCQPDRPAGRKLELKACAVKRAAQDLGVPVHQPVKVRTGDLHERLRSLRTDLAVVLAYGRILPSAVLSAPRLGCVNLHASILPKYRGAAPINWAIANGETETGVSLMQMDEGLDTGPVFSTRRIAIPHDMDAGALSAAIAALAAAMVREDLLQVTRGDTPAPQNHEAASYAPPIGTEDTLLSFALPSERLHNLVRAFAPTPGAHCFHRGRRLKLLKTRPLLDEPTLERDEKRLPGTIVECAGSSLVVGTGSGLLAIEQAQLEGKKALSAADLVNGRSFALGDRLESRRT